MRRPRASLSRPGHSPDWSGTFTGSADGIRGCPRGAPSGRPPTDLADAVPAVPTMRRTACSHRTVTTIGCRCTGRERLGTSGGFADRECCGRHGPGGAQAGRSTALVSSGRGASGWCRRIATQGPGKSLQVGDRHGESRVTASPKGRGHLGGKVNANAGVVVRTKAQPVINT